MEQLLSVYRLGGKAFLTPVVALAVWAAAAAPVAAQSPPDSMAAIKSSFAVNVLSQSIYHLYGAATNTPDLTAELREQLHKCAINARARQRQQMDDAATAANNESDAALKKTWEALAELHEAMLDEGGEILKDKSPDPEVRQTQMSAFIAARIRYNLASKDFLNAVRTIPGGSTYFGE